MDYTTEYLIMHENEIDWEELSKNPDRSFSLIEVRLFRKRINWLTYLPRHRDTLTTEILEMASKYFTDSVYKWLSYMNIPTEEFILRHKEKFDIPAVIHNRYNLSEEFLLEMIDYWKDNDTIKTSIPLKYDLTLPEYKSLRLLFEVE